MSDASRKPEGREIKVTVEYPGGEVAIFYLSNPTHSTRRNIRQADDGSFEPCEGSNFFIVAGYVEEVIHGPAMEGASCIFNSQKQSSTESS